MLFFWASSPIALETIFLRNLEKGNQSVPEILCNMLPLTDRKPELKEQWTYMEPILCKHFPDDPGQALRMLLPLQKIGPNFCRELVEERLPSWIRWIEKQENKSIATASTSILVHWNPLLASTLCLPLMKKLFVCSPLFLREDLSLNFFELFPNWLDCWLALEDFPTACQAAYNISKFRPNLAKQFLAHMIYQLERMSSIPENFFYPFTDFILDQRHHIPSRELMIRAVNLIPWAAYQEENNNIRIFILSTGRENFSELDPGIQILALMDFMKKNTQKAQHLLPLVAESTIRLLKKDREQLIRLLQSSETGFECLLVTLSPDQVLDNLESILSVLQEDHVSLLQVVAQKLAAFPLTAIGALKKHITLQKTLAGLQEEYNILRKKNKKSLEQKQEWLEKCMRQEKRHQETIAALQQQKDLEKEEETEHLQAKISQLNQRAKEKDLQSKKSEQDLHMLNEQLKGRNKELEQRVRELENRLKDGERKKSEARSPKTPVRDAERSPQKPKMHKVGTQTDPVMETSFFLVDETPSLTPESSKEDVELSLESIMREFFQNKESEESGA